MSAPGDQSPQATPIRVVPYSPPRPRPSEESDRTPGPASGSARQDEPPSFSTDMDDARNTVGSDKPSGTGTGFGRSGREFGPPLSMAKRPEPGGVSGRGEPATLRGPSTAESTDQRSGLSPSVIPVNYPPPSRGRLSTASYTTGSTRQSMSSRSSHVSDTESEAPSTASTQRRPQSSRRKFVAVLNDDKKTFSLVQQAQQAVPVDPVTDSYSEQSLSLPRSESALSEYGAGPSFRSAQLHSFPAASRASQASSHEGISSYASSQYERPSSSLGENALDRSITPCTPTSIVPSSPGLTITEDLVPDSSPTPWNFRMVGGLRRVPNLSSEPEAEGEGKHVAPRHAGSSDTLTPLPAVTDSGAPAHDENPVGTSSIGHEQESLYSSPHSSGSDTTNYRVYKDDDSEGPPEPETRVPSDEQQVPALQESLLDQFLRPQPSFATARTGSTEADNTNYKVYGHTDSEGSEEEHQDSPTAGPSARALRIPHIPQLEPQSSIASFQSVASDLSDSTNIRVYGPSSPGLEPVPEFSPLQSAHEIRPSASFLSTVSTLPDNENFIVYGRNSSGSAALSSVESFNPPSPSGSYAPLIRPTTAYAFKPFNAQDEPGGPSSTGNADPNYVTHGGSTSEHSAATSESEGAVIRNSSGQEFTEESSVVSPVRPRRSQDGFGYFRARSRSNLKDRDELHTKKSLRSAKSSISSIITEEAAEGFFAGQAYLDGPPGEYETSNPSVAGPSERQRQLDEQRERERQEREAAAWEGERAAPGWQGSMALPATPHQWSSQLSTVISESEPDDSNRSNRTHSSLASVSLPGSPNGHGSQGSSAERRNSRGWSTHSRQMLSISSSLAADMESHSRSRSNSQSVSIERPSPSQRYQGEVRHHDEDGDGLADLQVASPRPSRTRLSDMFHLNGSDRNLHSSASTGSFNNGIPVWAKVYYGSGERRWMRHASISSSMSDFSSRPDSAVQPHNGSPASDHFPMGLWNTRRRPQEAHPGRRRSITGSMVDQPRQSSGGDDHVHELGFRRGIRRMTSSVWSPHLRRDVRAQHRYTMWDTPSVAWSAESGMFGRRNMQVILFVAGFAVPFAWMLGAVLPLPRPSPLAMVQRDSSYSDLGVRSSSHEFERHIETADELRFQNARWWRMLNRCMSVIGLLIIGAVVGLAVAAVKQGWGTRS